MSIVCEVWIFFFFFKITKILKFYISYDLYVFSLQMAIATGLWERGLLVSAHPLDAQYDD